MANRLSTYDRKVRELVRSLEKRGYDVRADVRGRKKPRPIGPDKLVPDIEANWNGFKLIVEVETHDSFRERNDELVALADYAYKKPDMSLHLVVTKPRPRRAKVSPAQP